MNRRNFVVGLGTVATLSGVASVTSASFADSVNPSTNFQIVALEGNLVVRRLQANVDYGTMAAGNDSWNESSIGDFGNVTRESNQNNSVVAHVNSTENGDMGAELAFEARNTTYEAYTVDDTLDDGGYGFFEIANLGETDEQVGITFTYNSDNVATTDGDVDTSTGVPLSQSDVAEIFKFRINGTPISPTSSTTDAPENQVEIEAGEIAVVGLEITLTEDQVSNVQEVAGSSPFGGGALEEYSLRLLDEITVGVDYTP